jgi:hypothetical protein
LTPGSDYPVCRTNFGTVGIMICRDSQYADPARALALNGTELLLMPIWGGNETLVKARAIENRVFIATSGYNYPTHILDPDGKLLAAATDQGSVAFATIDLSRRYTDDWLGDMRGRFMKELRLDVKVAHPADRCAKLQTCGDRAVETCADRRTRERRAFVRLEIVDRPLVGEVDGGRVSGRGFRLTAAAGA